MNLMVLLHIVGGNGGEVKKLCNAELTVVMFATGLRVHFKWLFSIGATLLIVIIYQ